jgi:LPXTG-motif cell wall-anchored protein
MDALVPYINYIVSANECFVTRIESRGQIVRWIHRWSVVFCAVTLLVAVVYVVSPVPVLALTPISQVGGDIDGELAGDYSGWSVAMSGDGSRIAVGAIENDGTGSSAGHVRVYTLISGTWTQTGADIDGELAADYSGYSVAMSDDGSRVAVGAIYNDGTGSSAGHVRVYTLISGTWTQTGLDINGEAASDESGCSVAMSGDGSRIAIGAPNNDGNGSNAGHVRVYTLINGTWTQTGADINGEAAGDLSGYSVAMSDDGSRIAIGAIANRSNAGHVRVYTLISGTWTQTGADIDGEAASDRSGYSVAMSGDGSRIAIGAYLNGGTGSDAGHVRVYTLINGTWTQTGADIDGEAADDVSGTSVAMSKDGSRIAIGASNNDGTYSNAGHVRVYTLINGIWTQTGADIDGEAADDESGRSVAMSGDGSRIAIGAYSNNGTGSDAGHVRVYGVPTVPVAPSITSVVGANGSLTVTFTSGADGGSPITNYKYSTDGTNYIALNPATTSSPFIISGLTNATTYSVTIKAVNVFGDSLNSNAVSGTPIAPAAIVEPTTTTVAATTTTVAATTTTTVAAVAISSTKKVTETKNELPQTGSDSFPLVALALGLLSAGLFVTTRKRFARR